MRSSATRETDGGCTDGSHGLMELGARGWREWSGRGARRSGGGYHLIEERDQVCPCAKKGVGVDSS